MTLENAATATDFYLMVNELAERRDINPWYALQLLRQSTQEIHGDSLASQLEMSFLLLLSQKINSRQDEHDE